MSSTCKESFDISQLTCIPVSTLTSLIQYLDNTYSVKGTDMSGFAIAYDHLFDFDDKMRFTYDVARQNLHMCRYSNILASDQNRVVTDNCPFNNYDRVPFDEDSAFFIGDSPIYSTISAFWKMVLFNGVTTIVMLTDTIPGKAEKYWPNLGAPFVFAGITVESISTTTTGPTITRIFRLRDGTNKDRIVNHIQFTRWPDHGVPIIDEFMTLLDTVTMAFHIGHPLVVHCSAGIGRSGTFATIFAELNAVREQYSCKISPKNITVDPFNRVVALRRFRANLVQSPDQLRFCYQAILEGVSQIIG